MKEQIIEKVIRLPEVKNRVGLGTTAIYARIKTGLFPKQVKQGRLSGWYESEIQAYVKGLDSTRATQA